MLDNQNQNQPNLKPPSWATEPDPTSPPPLIDPNQNLPKTNPGTDPISSQVVLDSNDPSSPALEPNQSPSETSSNSFNKTPQAEPEITPAPPLSSQKNIDMSNLNTAGYNEDQAQTPDSPLNHQFQQMDQNSPTTELNPNIQLEPQSEIGTDLSSSEDTIVPPPNFNLKDGTPLDNSDKENFNQPVAASLKSNSGVKKILIPLFIILFLAIIAFIVIKVVLPKLNPENNNKIITNNDSAVTKNPTQAVSLTYWGLWEPESVYKDLFTQFESQNPGVTIQYQVQDKKDYRERLQTAINSGIGPDIFRMHNTWLPMMRNYIQYDSKAMINLSQFFPVISNNLAINGQTMAVPLSYEGLVLYYNPALLEKANIQPPTTWVEVISSSQALTTKDTNGDIKVAGIALGGTDNIDHFSDIIGLMILQNGGDPSTPESAAVSSAIQVYTSFSLKYKVWDSKLPNSTYAFATEKVAMFFAPSWKAAEISQINPGLAFQATQVPQLADTDISWATYWADSVSKNSKNPDLAWKLLAFLTQDENLQTIYNNQMTLRNIGQVLPKISLAQNQSSDKILGPLSQDANNAKSWYLSSRTYDNGINDKTITYYENAINSILNGEQVEKALASIKPGITDVLESYGLSSN